MEENKDIKNENSQEAVDKASFADVNYDEEEVVQEAKANKSKENGKGRLIVAAAVLVATVIALILAVVFFVKGRSDESADNKKNFKPKDVYAENSGNNGLANSYNDPIGAASDGYLYHSNFMGNEIYKTKIDSENFDKQKILDASGAFFAQHNGEFYFSDVENKKLVKYKEDGKLDVIYDGVSYYHQYVGDYVYFITPVNNYGGFVKRVSLKGGAEAETVLNVSTSNFCVSGEEIVYYDPVINTLCVTSIANALEFAYKAEGNENTSNEIGALALTEKFAKNINVLGKDVYFVDATDERNIICHIDMEEGTEEEMNFGTGGTLLNVSGEYIFYIGSDKHLYRMNLDGKDIRDFTGNIFKEVMGFSINDDYVVLYANMPKLNEEMRSENRLVIGVYDIEGTPLVVFPDDSINTMPYEDGVVEIPDMAGEIPQETEG